jgi:site-specific DNA recombinase
MIEAFSEQLITIDELRARMPDMRAREANLRGQIDAVDTQLADRETYLKLAANLGGFSPSSAARPKSPPSPSVNACYGCSPKTS